MDERYKQWHDKAIKSIDYLQEMADRNPETGTPVYTVYPSVLREDSEPSIYWVWGDVRDWEKYSRGTVDVAKGMLDKNPKLEKFVLFFGNKEKIEYWNGERFGTTTFNASCCIPEPSENYNFLFEHEQDALDYIAWHHENGLGGENNGMIDDYAFDDWEPDNFECYDDDEES